MTDLITWLRAQLDSDERKAGEATSGPWVAMGTYVEQADVEEAHTVADVTDCEDHPGRRWPDATHIARHDPARVLRQVQAHRAILDDYARAMERRKQHPDDLASAGALLALHGVVKRLASIYSHRDGYREEWSA